VKPTTPSEKAEHPRDFVGLYAKTIPPAPEEVTGVVIEGVVIEGTVNHSLPALIVVPSKQTWPPASEHRHVGQYRVLEGADAALIEPWPCPPSVG